jgi:uncharacterized protein YkwD
MLAFVACCAPAAPAAAHGTSAPARMVAKINEFRAVRGLPALRAAPKLERSGIGHAHRLMAGDYLAHASFRAPFDTKGEVIAMHRGWRFRASLTIRRWLRSPSHRPLLLSRSFGYVGAGRATGRFGSHRSTIWVVRFGG